MLMCIVYLVFMLGLVGIGGFAIATGNPQRLVYPTDYKGHTCGTTNGGKMDLTAKKRVVFPRMNEDMIANLQKTDPRDYKFYGICVERCPQELEFVCNYDVAYTLADKQNCFDFVTNSSTACKTIRKNCWVMPIAQTEVLFRCLPLNNVTAAETTKCLYPRDIQLASDPRCILAEDTKDTQVKRPAQKNFVFEQLSSAAALWGRYVADLTQAWWVVGLCAIIVPLLFSFGFIKFLQYFTACVVWLIVYLSIAVSIAATVIAYAKAGLLNAGKLASYADKVAGLTNGTVISLDSTVLGSALDSSAGNQENWKYVAYFLTAVTVIMILTIVAIRKQIQDSINIITLGANAISAMPLMPFFPLVTVAMLLGFFFFWIYVAAGLMSSGSEETVAAGSQATTAKIAALYPGFNATAIAEQFGQAVPFVTYSVNDIMFYLQIYHVFGLLWTAQFIQAISVLTIAGAVGAYYFSLDGRESNPAYGTALVAWKVEHGWKKGGAGSTAADGKSAPTLKKEEEIPVEENVPDALGEHSIPHLRLFRKTGHRGSGEVLAAFARTCRRHIGTAAFGSLLIAIVQMLRLVMTYINQQLESVEKSGAGWVKYIKWCLNYYLWCLEQCVKFVTRNSFVYTAIKGYSFCRAARAVFMLILRKTSLLAFVNVMVDVLIFLAQVSIAVLSGMVCYGLLENLTVFGPGGDSEVFSSWLPTLVVMVFAYYVASFFFNTFDVAVDTMLISYCIDMEECKVKNGNETPLHYIPGKSGTGCCSCCSCCGGSNKSANDKLKDATEHYKDSKSNMTENPALSA
jgi:hypothetical protein